MRGEDGDGARCGTDRPREQRARRHGAEVGVRAPRRRGRVPGTLGMRNWL